MPASAMTDRVDAVRRFNRFYTRQIGVLNEGFLDSPLSLTQGRVLYELAHREQPTASDIGEALGLDAGYLSRMLRDFRRQRLVTTTPAPGDARRRLLALTAGGRRMVATLDARARRQVSSILGPRSEADQARLLEAMATIRGVLGSDRKSGLEAEGIPEVEAPGPQSTAFTLRPHRVGDMGWITHRQGLLYAQEYGWDARFEALVARITADFTERFDPARERCWIAEGPDGAILGSVFVVRHTKTTAKLRLLYVEPEARGLGIGKRLVDECVAFAREAGYRRLTLWTNSILDAARRLYERAGFVRVAGDRQHRFGHDLVFETWTLDLRR